MFNQLYKRVQWGTVRRVLPNPVPVRHAEYSMLYSEDDALSRPSERLLDISSVAIAKAREINLDSICQRLQGRYKFSDNILNVWPGEHYRLLAALVEVIQPKLAIEIGTAEGMSALTMLEALPIDGRIVTFDLIPWPDYPRPCLQQEDFADGPAATNCW